MLLTILMYVGVVIFLFPYFVGMITAGVGFMIGGAALAVVSGLLRCYLWKAIAVGFRIVDGIGEIRILNIKRPP
jgi:hypothetical protein